MRAARALDWMDTHGRAVDRARVAAELGRAAPSTVVEPLAGYHNADGGFGRALEPDVRLADSSVLATTVALQLLARYRLDDATGLLDGASRYLVDTFDRAAAAWPVVPRHVSTAPHAPWWNYRPPSDCLVIPRAEILGYAYRWPGFAAGVDLDRVTTEVADHVKSTDSVEMHELMMFNRLFTSPNLPPELDGLHERYLDLARRTIPVKTEDWKGYALMPVTIIDGPDHPLAGEFAEPVARNLEYLWSLQTDDGSWDPPWSWFGQHPGTWPEAEKDIRSLITARTIGTLHRFGAFE